MSFKIRRGDVRVVLSQLEANSYDGCLTDPPYGLTQNKKGGSGVASLNLSSPAGRSRITTGFMGMAWDHGVPNAHTWRHVYRVLKPGAFLLAFGGTRTHHRLMCAIEDAGFEIRDCMMWLYGSGFPKSMDISKAIDKAGISGPFHLTAERDMAAEIRECRESKGISRSELASWFPYKEVTKNWERIDAGFRVPTEADYQVLVDRLGISGKWRKMVRAEDVRLKTPGVKINRRGDGSVYGLAHSGSEYAATSVLASSWAGYGTALKPAWEPIIVAMKPLDGTFAGNALKHGVAGINVDGSRIGAFVNTTPSGVDRRNAKLAELGYRPNSYQVDRSDLSEKSGRWPANVILDEETGLLLDAQSGLSKSTGGNNGNLKGVGAHGIYGKYGSQALPGNPGLGDFGGASRFFYCAKASPRERNSGLTVTRTARQVNDGRETSIDNAYQRGDSLRFNAHPTVKPVDLCRYLAQLILPPYTGTPRRLLVPFCGSGSEMIGARNAGWKNCLGIEIDPEYVAIARRRLTGDFRRLV